MVDISNNFFLELLSDCQCHNKLGDASKDRGIINDQMALIYPLLVNRVGHCADVLTSSVTLFCYQERSNTPCLIISYDLNKSQV